MSAVEKVHHIGPEHEGEEMQEEQKEVQAERQPAELIDKTGRDIGKVALFVSILSVVLLVVFFFGLNQNLTGLSARVDSLITIKDDVNALGTRVGTVEDRIVALEGLPKKAKQMVMGTMLQEMAQRADYLGSQMETDEQTAKLKQAMELLQQVQTEIVVE